MTVGGNMPLFIDNETGTMSFEFIFGKNDNSNSEFSSTLGHLLCDLSGNEAMEKNNEHEPPPKEMPNEFGQKAM
jgi:hypothetical protein